MLTEEQIKTLEEMREFSIKRLRVLEKERRDVKLTLKFIEVALQESTEYGP